MGSENGGDGEKPIHEVYLDGYYIDLYEVTNDQYQGCVEAGSCTAPHLLDAYNNGEKGGYPVVNVDWYQAQAFCKWAGKRLPTEAQWEKAARGTDGRTYPWGEDISCERANYEYGCVGDPTPVGSYLDGVSPYGVHDMAGNVWEWTSSEYKDYPYQADDGREDLERTDVRRVLRGGSWNYNLFYVRSAARSWRNPVDDFNYLGFRCALSP